jgi:hypothetical protein
MRHSLFAVPFLLLLPAACSHGNATTAIEPTPALRSFPVESLAATAAAALRQIGEQGHRHGLRIEPPGHHFATFLVVGTIGERAVDVLVEVLAAAGASHLRAAGAELDRIGEQEFDQVPEAVRRAILGRATTGADRVLRARTGQYRVGGRTGWITLLAVREDGATETWRIGGAAHEPYDLREDR